MTGLRFGSLRQGPKLQRQRDSDGDSDDNSDGDSDGDSDRNSDGDSDVDSDGDSDGQVALSLSQVLTSMSSAAQRA